MKRSEGKFGGLGRRVAVALAGIPLMLAAAWGGGIGLFLLVLAISLLGYREFIHLAGGRLTQPVWIWGMAGTLLVVVFFQWPQLSPIGALAWFLGQLLLMLFLGSPGRTLFECGVSLWGIGYIPVLLGHMILLRASDPDRGFWWLLWTMALVWIGDTGAYFAGLAWGRRRLAPAISPNKTVEGLAGGALAAAAAAVGLEAWWRLGLGPGPAVALSLVVTAFGTVGDLVESKIKRMAGAKDSGNLLPGHGGILDRFDSLMLAVPAVYWYLRWF